MLTTFVWWIFLTPLQVLTPRLAIQPTYSPLLEEEGAEGPVQDAGCVVRVRGKGDDVGMQPYTGWWDAVGTIGREEGHWKVLYRLFYLVPIDLSWVGTAWPA